MTLCKQFCPGWCHLVLCTSGCCPALAGTSVCRTESSTTAQMPLDTAPTFPMAPFPIAHICPPSDLSDQPSKKMCQVSSGKRVALMGVRTEEAAFPLKLLSVPLRAHSGAADGLEHHPGCQVQSWWNLLLETLLTTTGARASERTSVTNFYSFDCPQERINIQPGNQIVINFSAVNPRASIKDYMHALFQR